MRGRGRVKSGSGTVGTARDAEGESDETGVVVAERAAIAATSASCWVMETLLSWMTGLGKGLV